MKEAAPGRAESPDDGKEPEGKRHFVKNVTGNR